MVSRKMHRNWQFLLRAHENLKPFSFVLKQEIWAPPIPNNVKLNYDASFIATPKRSISCSIARNESGEILVAWTYPHYHVADAFTADVWACEQTLAFAHEPGFRSIFVGGGLLTVTKKLHNVSLDKSGWGQLFKLSKRKEEGLIVAPLAMSNVQRIQQHILQRDVGFSLRKRGTRLWKPWQRLSMHRTWTRRNGFQEVLGDSF